MIIEFLGGIILLGFLVMLINSLRKRGTDTYITSLIIIDIALLAIIVTPGSLESYLTGIGFARPFDAFISIIAAASFFLAIRSYIRLREVERSLTRAVQKAALKSEVKKG